MRILKHASMSKWQYLWLLTSQLLEHKIIRVVSVKETEGGSWRKELTRNYPSEMSFIRKESLMARRPWLDLKCETTKKKSASYQRLHDGP